MEDRNDPSRLGSFRSFHFKIVPVSDAGPARLSSALPGPRDDNVRYNPMKQCLLCKTTYTDDTLQFCLADGSELTTVVPGPRESGRKSSSLFKVLVIAAILTLLGLAVVGLAGFAYFVATSNTETSAGPSPTPRTTPDPEKERLQKELSELQKRLEEQNKTPPQKSPDPPKNDGRPTARVDSPNDGFLALRSAPDTEKGTRLAQIPHGAEVYLENCEKETANIGGRKGRWCMVTYRDDTGWVFDAWLTY